HLRLSLPYRRPRRVSGRRQSRRRQPRTGGGRAARRPRRGRPTRRPVARPPPGTHRERAAPGDGRARSEEVLRSRTRRAVGAVLALATVACSPSEPPTSEPTGPPPLVEFTATVTRDGDELRITYRLTNEDNADLYVLNRVVSDVDPDPLGSSPELVYVTG